MMHGQKNIKLVQHTYTNKDPLIYAATPPPY